MHGNVGPLIGKRKNDSWGTFAQEVLGQVKENNCKVQLVVVGPVLLPTPGQDGGLMLSFGENLGEIRV